MWPRRNGGEDDRRLELPAELHRGERREYDQAGNKERAHHAHAKDDRDGCEKGDDHIIEPCPCAGGGGERFIKGDCKYTVIKQNEKEHDGDAEDDGKAHVIGAHGKDAAEHVVAHVGIHSRT